MSISHVQYSVVTDARELLQYKDRWDSLLEKASRHSAMLSYAWISNYLTRLLPQAVRSWACFFATSEQKLCAVLPLTIEKRVLPVPHMVAIAPHGGHLNITDILADRSAGPEVFWGLLGFVFRTYPQIGYCEFLRMPPDSPILGQTPATMPAVASITTERSKGYFLPIPEDYSSYERTLSRNFKKNLKKATNKLNRLPGVHYEFLEARSNTDDCFRRFCNLERSGWKGRSGTAISQSDRLKSFYLDTLHDLERIGILEWHFLRSEDEDLAGHMAFRLGDKLVLWKLAYKESYSSCSPGSQLMRELVQREIESGRSAEIDLTTDQHWYSNWNMSSRPYFHLRIYNLASPRGIVLRWTEECRQLLRRSPAVRSGRNVLDRMIGRRHGFGAGK